MNKLSEQLDIGDNYLRSDICALMGKSYEKDAIERGIYKPKFFDSVILFSTLKNESGYINFQLDEKHYIFSGKRNFNDTNLINHYMNGYELLLFIRETQETGFYYYGSSKYCGEAINLEIVAKMLKIYQLPFYIVELLETTLSKVSEIHIPKIQ